MGTDTFSNIDSWHQWEEFIRIVNIIIMDRPGSSIHKKSEAYKILKTRLVKSYFSFFKHNEGKILLVNIKPIDVSSSNVRTKLNLGDEVKGMIHEDINSFIKKHKLYI